MSVRDVDGLNVGYAQALLEQYLENPEAVPEEWRSLFESGDPAIVEALPGLARLVESLKENGAPAQAEAPPEPASRRRSRCRSRRGSAGARRSPPPTTC